MSDANIVLLTMSRLQGYRYRHLLPAMKLSGQSWTEHRCAWWRAISQRYAQQRSDMVMTRTVVVQYVSLFGD